MYYICGVIFNYDTMITIKDFAFRYSRKGNYLFSNFNLSLELGHIYGLLGCNGVGKSTLLYSIVGLLRPEKGAVLCDGIPTMNKQVDTLQKIFIVPEEFELPRMTMNRYVELNSVFYPNFSNDDFVSYLQCFDIEGNPELNYLSMGQKKKILICFALACNTPWLFMDEPTNGLDIPAKSQFRKVIAMSMNENRSIVISTHQVGDIENLLDHIVILDNNRILLNRPVDDIVRVLSFGENAVDAIYSQPWAGGIHTVSPNLSGVESELYLDLLFNAVIAKPNEISELF